MTPIFYPYLFKATDKVRPNLSNGDKMKQRQISTNHKVNRRTRVGAIANVMLVGAIAAGFAACQSPKAVTAVSRDQSVAEGETARPEHERLWRQPADAEQNLRAAGQKQGVNGVREQKIQNGTLLKTLKGHTAPVNGVSFSPDGQTLASSSWDNTIKL